MRGGFRRGRGRDYVRCGENCRRKEIERLVGDRRDDLRCRCAQCGAKRDRRRGRCDSCRLWRKWRSERHRDIQRNVRRDNGWSIDLSRRGSLDQRGRDRLEVKRSLNAGFDASSDEDSFEPAVSELDGIGVERVFAGIERGEAEGPIPGSGGADFCAGGLGCAERSIRRPAGPNAGLVRRPAREPD